MNPLLHRVLIVVWPSFLMAGVLETLVFAFVDPARLQWLSGAPLAVSATAVYSIAFLVFWLVISLAGAITQVLAMGVGETETDREPELSTPPVR